MRSDEDGVRERVVEALRAGELVVVPTDTVYAVVADAFQSEATARIFAARHASRQAPLTVFVRSPRQLNGLTERRTEQADRLVAACWPGPLTLVLPAADGVFWDLGDARGTVALRMAPEQLLLDVIAEVGPVAGSAASSAGGPPPTTVEIARDALGDAVSLYVDAGKRDATVSTIVDASRGGAEVLRVGAVSADEVVAIASGAVGWGRPTEPAEPAEESSQADDPSPPSADD